jgi:hypothetical protein
MERVFQSATAPAILLASAAIVTAVAGARASMLKGEASGAWESAIRVELKEGAATTIDEQTAYGEAAVAGRTAEALTRADELTGAAAGIDAFSARALLTEARVLLQTAEDNTRLAPAAVRFTATDGAFDLKRRLADLAQRQDVSEPLSPARLREQGDSAGRRASVMTLAAIPAALAILLAGLAQARRRAREPLVAVGLLLLAAAVAVAVVAEAASFR